MGILTRLKALFRSWFRPVSAEPDPVASLDSSLAKLEQSRQDVRRSLVDISTARLRLEKQHRQLQSRIDRYDEQAQAALVANDDGLAWEALQRKQAAIARRSELENDLSSLERQLASLKQSQANLDRRVGLFRAKKETLKALHTSSEAQLRVQEALAGVSEELTGVNSTIERTERRIQEMQARAEAIEQLVDEGVLPNVLQPETDEIDRRLAGIDRRQAVEEELARLKAALPEEAVPRLDARQAEALAELKAEVESDGKIGGRVE